MTAPGWRSLVPSRPKSAPILVSWDQYNSLWVNSCPHLCRVWTPGLKSVAIFWEFGIYTCIIMKKWCRKKVLVLTSIKMLISSHHKVHLSRSSSQSPASSLGAFKCSSQIVLFHFGQNKIILGLNFGFGSFRHFPAWQVWVLGDIERKAIYFNQGLPAQLLTIVGWMGAINKTYGPLPQQLASTSKPVAARRQHGCRRAADRCLYLRNAYWCSQENFQPNC